MKLVIPQKMSNSGTIHDLASDQYDREIEMTGYTHAVVTPSYYQRAPSRHKSAEAALARARRDIRDGYEGVLVIDQDANIFDIELTGLVDAGYCEPVIIVD